MSGADLAMMDAPIKVIFPFKYLRRETCSAGLSYNNDKDFTVWISDILYFDHSEDCRSSLCQELEAWDEESADRLVSFSSSL